MKNVDESQYQKVLELQKTNNNPYTEHFRGSRKTLVVFGREIVSTVVGGNSLHLGSLSQKKFASFLGSFKKSLYSQFNKRPELLELDINFSGSSRAKNRNKFDDLPINSFFYNVDISSAYWQVAYRLGYISKPFYQKYLKKEEYKAVKRLCFSFLSRTNFRTYNLGGTPITISCQNDIERKVYQNVRKELYKIISGALEKCDGNYIDYNIDALSVTKENRTHIVEYFNSQSIDIKIFPCQKISKNQYTIKSTIRTF